MQEFSLGLKPVPALQSQCFSLRHRPEEKLEITVVEYIMI